MILAAVGGLQTSSDGADGEFVRAGDAFFVVTGSAQVKVYDRDGKERGESVRGDMYIRDQRHTKGHVSPATFGQWHPTDKCACRTFSEMAHSSGALCKTPVCLTCLTPGVSCIMRGSP